MVRTRLLSHLWRMRNRIQAYHDGELPAPSRDAFARHLESCDRCRQALGRLARTEERLISARPEPLPMSPATQTALFQRALAKASAPARPLFRTVPVMAACGAAVLALLALAVFHRPVTTHGIRNDVAQLPSPGQGAGSDKMKPPVPTIPPPKAAPRVPGRERREVANADVPHRRHRARLHPWRIRQARISPQTLAGDASERAAIQTKSRTPSILLVIVENRADAEPEKPAPIVKVEEAPVRTPGYAQVAAYRADPAGIGGTWTQYDVSRDSEGAMTARTSETSLAPDMRASVLTLQMAQLPESTPKGIQQ